MDSKIITKDGSLSSEQKCQEEQYSIPYHYITQYKPNFKSFYYDAWGISYVSTIEFLIDQIKKTHFDSIIDIGCGDGRFTRELSQNCPNSRIIGIDYSSKSIAMAKVMNPKIDFSVCDITSWIPESLFDCAVLMEVFEHIPPTIAASFVKGVSSLLRPGGILFLTVPHLNEIVHPHHYRHFDVAMLQEEWGIDFQIVQVFGFEKIGLMRTIMLHFLCNRFFLLNNRRLLNFVYTFYKKNLFYVKSERQAQRIYLKAIKKG